MELLNPAGLFIFFALLIPIIVHLAKNRKRKQFYIGSTAWLSQLPQAKKSRTRLEKLLLLFLRLLLLTVLAFLLAKPLVKVDASEKLASFLIAKQVTDSELDYINSYLTNHYSSDSNEIRVYYGTCQLTRLSDIKSFQNNTQSYCLDDVKKDFLTYVTSMEQILDDSETMLLVNESIYERFAVSNPFVYLESGQWMTKLMTTSNLISTLSESPESELRSGSPLGLGIGKKLEIGKKLGVGTKLDFSRTKKILIVISNKENQFKLDKLLQDFSSLIDPLKNSIELKTITIDQIPEIFTQLSQLQGYVPNVEKALKEHSELIFIVLNNKTDKISIWLMHKQEADWRKSESQSCKGFKNTNISCQVLQLSGDTEQNSNWKESSPLYLVEILQKLLAEKGAYIGVSHSTNGDLVIDDYSTKNITIYLIIVFLMLFVLERLLATFLFRRSQK
ncbi:MAG: BatA domain-containing protein [Gammaproteobacteria bacterium]|nr:BatA domain-containing protein [Gammaproteobacteria bacterium]